MPLLMLWSVCVWPKSFKFTDDNRAITIGLIVNMVYRYYTSIQQNIHALYLGFFFLIVLFFDGDSGSFEVSIGNDFTKL